MNWILWLVFVLTVALGCLFMVSLEHVVASLWSVPLRRVPERLSSLVFLAVPIALVALTGVTRLYPGTSPQAAADPVLSGKAFWLSLPFFSTRAIVCFALWIVSFFVLVGGSMKQDRTKNPAFNIRARWFSPLFMMIFAFTLTAVAFDWISGLEPKWYSDILGVYLFAGTFLAGISSTALAVIYLREKGRLPGVRIDHLYNLGGLLFAFTIFWAYIAFAQYLLMWYANMPEEVFWFKPRTEGKWGVIFVALFVIRYIVPFLVLISRRNKSSVKILGAMAAWILLGHLVDLYWLMFPVLRTGPIFGWQEAAFALFFLATGLLWVRRAMTRGEDMPAGDPFLKAGLEFRL